MKRKLMLALIVAHCWQASAHNPSAKRCWTDEMLSVEWANCTNAADCKGQREAIERELEEIKAKPQLSTNDHIRKARLLEMLHSVRLWQIGHNHPHSNPYRCDYDDGNNWRWESWQWRHEFRKIVLDNPTADCWPLEQQANKVMEKQG